MFFSKGIEHSAHRGDWFNFTFYYIPRFPTLILLILLDHLLGVYFWFFFEIRAFFYDGIKHTWHLIRQEW